jgi:hypothetical protein
MYATFHDTGVSVAIGVCGPRLYETAKRIDGIRVVDWVCV